MKNFVTPKIILLISLCILGFAFVASFFSPDLGLVVAVVAFPALLFFTLIGKLSQAANPNPNQSRYGWKSVLIGLLVLGAIFGIASLFA